MCKKSINQKLNGKNNQQTVNYYNGSQYSLEDIEKISRRMAIQVIEEHYASANEKAKNRIDKFDNIFIDVASKEEGWAEMFEDPSFIFDFKSSQIQSAQTDDILSYKMLSNLLLHRSKNSMNKTKITSIKGAIKIVNQIDESSLAALTIATCVLIGVHPCTNILEEGLKVLNDLYGKILICDLPEGYKWLDQLDILNAIRINTYGKVKKFYEIMQNVFEGYIQLGIKKDSDNYFKYQKELADLGLNMFIENPFCADYVLLPFISYEQIDEISDEKMVNFSEKQKELLKSIYKSYEKNSSKISEIKTKFNLLLDSFENIKNINNWWNNIPNSFTITSIGRTLGHVNAINVYPDFPSLD